MRSRFFDRFIMALIAGAVLVSAAGVRGEEEQEAERTPDVIFVPTPHEVVEIMLRLADIKEDDVVYDLGCGDGRIVIAAAKKAGAKAWGYDIDPQRVKESRANVKKESVESLVTIEQKDIFTLDLSKVDVVTLYLLPSLNVKLIPQLEKMKPGSRIVSHAFDMAGVTPDVVATVNCNDGVDRRVYLWTTPLKKEAERTDDLDDIFGTGPFSLPDVFSQEN
jgi:precorrin-6B methylase 2